MAVTESSAATTDRRQRSQLQRGYDGIDAARFWLRRMARKSLGIAEAS
jgi:hypothetical protein